MSRSTTRAGSSASAARSRAESMPHAAAAAVSVTSPRGISSWTRARTAASVAGATSQRPTPTASTVGRMFVSGEARHLLGRAPRARREHSFAERPFESRDRVRREAGGCDVEHHGSADRRLPRPTSAARSDRPARAAAESRVGAARTGCRRRGPAVARGVRPSRRARRRCRAAEGIGPAACAVQRRSCRRSPTGPETRSPYPVRPRCVRRPRGSGRRGSPG